jgi:hypothetical protein
LTTVGKIGREQHTPSAPEFSHQGYTRCFAAWIDLKLDRLKIAIRTTFQDDRKRKSAINRCLAIS